MDNSTLKVGGIVLAAGESVRMGQPKMILPWGEKTVIGQVISILSKAHLDEIIVVTGGWREEVESALENYQIKTVYNSKFKEGGMLSSVKMGIKRLNYAIDAALITLGDQPHIKIDVVKIILETYFKTRSMLVVPSYRMRRGHPWLVDKKLWNEIFKLGSNQLLRNFLSQNQDLIYYVPVETNSILLDLDTPKDYSKNRPAK